MMTTTVVIGGSFAGMTAALEIKRKGNGQYVKRTITKLRKMHYNIIKDKS